MLTSKISRIAGLILLILILSACSQRMDPQVSISVADAGKTITLNKGDTLIVTLDGNITTGYNWEMLPLDPAILEQVGEPEVTPNGSQLGASGKIVLKFRAVQTGQAKLDLAYQRPFEKNTTPANTYEVTVDVN